MRKTESLLLALLVCFGCNSSNNDHEKDKLDSKMIDSDVVEIGDYQNGKKNGVWKTFENDSLISVNQYHNDTLQFNLDVNDFRWNSVNLVHPLNSIKVPSLWLEEAFKVENGTVLSWRKDCDKSLDYCPNLSLVQFSTDEDIDFSVLVKKELSNLVKRHEEIKFVAEGEIEVNQVQGYQVTYLTKTEGMVLGWVTTWLLQGNDIVVLTGTSLNQGESSFIEYKNLFMEITESVSFR
ncbi:MAG: hypothetical protein P8H59_12945 [Flavobacteriales bacterium]|nr:hypothetical protein [Flavobacteriales bacterium]